MALLEAVGGQLPGHPHGVPLRLGLLLREEGGNSMSAGPSPLESGVSIVITFASGRDKIVEQFAGCLLPDVD